jgi:uncharacterized Fe-S cluster-containing radical SAM superfamily protein
VRVAVALGRACDNHCVFCAQEGLPREAATDAAIDAALDRARASGATAVTLVGGEPALDPRLGAVIEKARAAGFAQVGIQTNGVALAAADGRVADLVARGLTDVHLSLHGAEPRVHDWHTGVPGSFEAALRTLGASRAEGLQVAVVTLLTRSSFRVLSAIPRLLASRGVAAWCLDVPRWRGRAAVASDRVIPRLALALPFALHALDGAARLGLPAFVRGAPSCLLGPFAAVALDPGAGSFGEACGRCPSQPACAGVDAEYLARFGGDELSTCPPAPRDPRHASLRAMFVGPGEMAPPSTAPVHPPPARARVALPLLGRPAPARAEVPASVPRQSGEALRTILPALFGEQAPAGQPEEP